VIDQSVHRENPSFGCLSPAAPARRVFREGPQPERASLIGRHRIVIAEFDVDLVRFPQGTVRVLHRGGPGQNVVAADCVTA
jgi:hypothetical protein